MQLVTLAGVGRAGVRALKRWCGGRVGKTTALLAKRTKLVEIYEKGLASVDCDKVRMLAVTLSSMCGHMVLQEWNIHLFRSGTQSHQKSSQIAAVHHDGEVVCDKGAENTGTNVHLISDLPTT